MSLLSVCILVCVFCLFFVFLFGAGNQALALMHTRLSLVPLAMAFVPLSHFNFK